VLACGVKVLVFEPLQAILGVLIIFFSIFLSLLSGGAHEHFKVKFSLLKLVPHANASCSGLFLYHT